ncbi:MAG: SMI1/KNR4 family protein [Planctomycetaceae bacterium]|nr:SMI1/KNR4 family protein [Planctomycetaceae bacterium]
MLTDRYYFDDGQSRKFWSIAHRGKSVVTTSGRLGAKGRDSTKGYSSPNEAKAAAKIAADEKVKKGYIRVDPSQLKFNRIDGTRKATEAQVAKFEKQIDARLPEEYRSFLLAYNGGLPVSEGIEVFGHPSPYGYIALVDPLYSLDPSVPEYQSLQAAVESDHYVLPSGHIPFADSGGNLVTIDLKNKVGAIFYFDHELPDEEHIYEDVTHYTTKQAILLAGSFDELLTRMAVYRPVD